MKSVILLICLLTTGFFASAQVQTLPEGRYETVVKEKASRWEKGDIVILDNTHYKISTSEETGEYRFSSTAQRIFFTSGPLKSVFAKTTLNGKTPAIVIPASENEQLGLRVATADVWGTYKQ
jgi:hypothetical protein